MKRYMSLLPAMLLAVCLTGCSGGGGVWSVILLIAALLLLAVAALRTRAFFTYRQRQIEKGRKAPQTMDMLTWGIYGLAGVLLLVSLILVLVGGAEPKPVTDPTETTEQTQPTEEHFQPQAGTDTSVDHWQIQWEIFDGGVACTDYQRQAPISFGDPSQYFALPGVSTFRGNNYRNSATYGTATVTEKTLTTVWTHNTGVIRGGSWSGNGWTGQPLMVEWDSQTRQIMNLHPEKKDKDNLVEVIYASLDGKIYFLDLDDGEETRTPIDVGMCFKGAGSLDPRGYPLLYVGSGDENANGERPRMFIISLITGEILYQYGDEDPQSLREDNDRWCAFDSAPLIHGETDTLIWPGENGNLYTIKLNTAYDKAAGTISVRPDAPVQTRYHTERSSFESYWYGYEASASIVGNYLYVSENGGMFFCVDLNTMELVWAQDTKDDSNSSPVFESAGKTEGYIYTAPSLHWTKDGNDQGTISIYKLDAITGQIVWEKPFDVHTVSGVSGGVQSTPLLGKPGTNLEGMIFYAVARTDRVESGTLVALDTATGDELWRLDMTYYAWSSPVGVYDENGNGYVVLCDSNGTAHFIDGATGQVLDTEYLGGLVEASPAVYNNMIVVGTRLKKICGIRIK